MSTIEKHTQNIKAKALQLGFSSIGIAKAEFLEAEAAPLEQWLKNNQHGEMQYMENHFDLRLDPRKLVVGAKSVIVLTHNYFPDETQCSDTFQIAKYAYGKDYHFVLKEKLNQLLSYIQEQIGDVSGRGFTDSAPIMERAWAKKAGIGWQGKNTLLLQKGKGSFFFLAELIVDVALVYDTPFQANHCGSCTRCVDACPTQAILPNHNLDASKCISYLTIELKNEIPSHFQNQWKDWIFGCDICQDVCPWNHFSLPHQEPLFRASPDLLAMNKQDWGGFTQDEFTKRFAKSALKRTKWEGLKRNILFVKNSKKNEILNI